MHAPSAYSSLLSTLSDMYTRGEVVRPRQGVYQIKPDDKQVLQAMAYES